MLLIEDNTKYEYRSRCVDGKSILVEPKEHMLWLVFLSGGACTATCDVIRSSRSEWMQVTEDDDD